MKCSEYNEKLIKYPCWAQFKLNGLSARYIDGKFYSRDCKEFSKNITDHMVKELTDGAITIPERLMLVGEFYHHGWPLERINSACSVIRQFATEDTFKIKFIPYDYWTDDHTLKGNFNFRVSVMMANNIPNLLPTVPINNQKELDLYYEHSLSLGYEGLVIKLQDLDYIDGKSKYIFKRKKFMDAEFECINISGGNGRLHGTVGALVCQTKEGRVFNVGSGLTDKVRAKFKLNPPIGKQIMVKFEGYSDEKQIPLKPIFMTVREDVIV